MDFFEKWFGISPDGGDGSLEALWIGVIVVAVTAVALRRRVVTWLMSHKAGQR
jgi:hypothetical protein